MFDKINAQRLTALADHLEHAERLNVDNFHFNLSLDTILNEYERKRRGVDHCGTVGCACGEASLLWPEHFRSGTGWFAMSADARAFFGTSEREHMHLFEPDSQDTRTYGGSWLRPRATQYEVAANIRAFLEYKRREEASA